MAGWLYTVDERGLRVAPEFYERLRNGETSALRALAKTDYTKHYREKYSALSVRPLMDRAQPRLFPEADPVPPHERFPDHILIPLVRGRDSPPSMVPGEVLYRATASKREIRFVQKMWKNDNVQVKVSNEKVTVTALKPNPKFELVVVNKYDRARLLNLLAALTPADNVETWLNERTIRTGATKPSVLHEDYKAWCASRGDAPTGSKSFSQKLVKAGVTKLTRQRGSELYELELRAAVKR